MTLYSHFRFRCSHCGKRFTQVGNLRSHLRVHARTILCGSNQLKEQVVEQESGAIVIISSPNAESLTERLGECRVQKNVDVNNSVPPGQSCMICGFVPSTKNKYRELQDHLVRKHFNDRVKAALPKKGPYKCPEPSCVIEGKDWQALMRHYTGSRHGVLERYLREIIDAGYIQVPLEQIEQMRRQEL